MKQNQFFLQMSGVPGSGKTTVATAVAKATGGVIVDHDVSKSALLDADVPVELAGPASYLVLQAIARHLLAQGHSVIFDSPCLYSEQLEFGLNLAREMAVHYLYIECVIEDLQEVDRRLRTRPRHRSQLASVFGEPTEGSGKSNIDDTVFRDWMEKMKRPDDYLHLDTSRQMNVVIPLAIDYVQKAIIPNATFSSQKTT